MNHHASRPTVRVLWRSFQMSGLYPEADQLFGIEFTRLTIDPSKLEIDQTLLENALKLEKDMEKDWTHSS